MPDQERPPDPPEGTELPEELLTQTAQLRVNDAEDVDQRLNALTSSHQEDKAKLEKALAHISELRKALHVAKMAGLEKALAVAELEKALTKSELDKVLAKVELEKALAHKATKHEKALAQIASLEKALAQKATEHERNLAQRAAEHEKALVQKAIDHEKALAQKAAEHEKLLTDNKNIEAAIKTMQTEHEKIVKELHDEICNLKAAYHEINIKRDSIRKEVTEEIFDGLPEISHKTKNVRDMAERLETTRRDLDAREGLVESNRAPAPPELDESVAKAYKEGDIRGYHRYAMDLDIALAAKGDFPGVTIEISRSAYLRDMDHPRCPMNIGYANGYSMTGAWGASCFNVEEFDLRCHKAPSVTQDMLQRLNPKEDSRYWQGFKRGRLDRVKEMNLVLQDLRKSGNV